MKLRDFLTRNSAVVGKSLPLVHTTQSYFIQRIIDQNEIKTSKCDCFNEELAYFFVGRPAYKKELGDVAMHWEMPTCFIFEYDATDAKRIHPFDTGAFVQKKYPSFINMMDLEEYNITGVVDGPQRVIGTFFGSANNYYKLRTSDPDQFNLKFSLGAFDAEVQALHRLVREGSSTGGKGSRFVDDRRVTVEIQFDKNVNLSSKKLLAIVVPEPYLEEKSFMRYCKDRSITVISYDIYPLSPSHYYALVYDKVFNYYRSKGFLT